MEDHAEVITILTMRVPRELAGEVKRHAEVAGDTAVQVMRLIAAARRDATLIRAEDAPTDLASAVEFDLSEIFSSLPPDCPICEELFDGPHSACEKKVLNYLRLS